MGRGIGPVVIRGVEYPSTSAAGKALGVTRDYVAAAARAGRLDLVGLGHSSHAMPIEVRGVVYPTARAAAKANGVTVAAVYQALMMGRLDRLGLKNCHGRARAKPFELFGLSWPSMAKASRALGFGSGYISIAYRRKSAAMIGEIEAAVMRESMRRNARVWQERMNAVVSLEAAPSRRAA